MLKSHKNHGDDQLPFLLTASCEANFPPLMPFILLVFPEVRAYMVKCKNYVKFGMNAQEPQPYRSDKSKSIS